MWASGVSFKAVMPLWIVIHPNLLNLYDQPDLAAAEFEQFMSDGWMQRGAAGEDGARCRFPTFPFFVQPRGAVAKKLGAAPRIIVDMGAPRRPLAAWRVCALCAYGRPGRAA